MRAAPAERSDRRRTLLLVALVPIVGNPAIVHPLLGALMTSAAVLYWMYPMARAERFRLRRERRTRHRS